MFDSRDWASEASPTLGCSIEISRDWASEASPTLGCAIEISRDWASEAGPTLIDQSDQLEVTYYGIGICYSTGRSDIRDIFHEL